MRLSPIRAFFSAAVCAAILGSATAQAATVNIPLNGNFNAGVSGSGTATLESASGTFRQWLLFTHANIGVTANKQTVPVNVTPVAPTNYSASGNSTVTYDDEAPPTIGSVDSLVADLNGAGSINLDMTVGNISISTSLGNFNLALTFDGQIDDLDFNSTDGSLPGGLYDVPGTFDAILNGSVKGTLVGVPIIGNVDLGTLFTLPLNTLVSVPGSLPGLATLTDGSGGSGPYPSTLDANFAFALPASLDFPLTLPFEEHLTASIPNGQSGFSKLDIVGQIDATLTLTNPSYNLNGSVVNAVVPEPSSVALAGLGALGLGLAAWRRR